ncbi:MAG: hypothetical protein IPK71_28115 [Myxococcales bacterium]|nr:hypothetical protein [Myxococcales bacterium]
MAYTKKSRTLFVPWRTGTPRCEEAASVVPSGVTFRQVTREHARGVTATG